MTDFTITIQDENVELVLQAFDAISGRFVEDDDGNQIEVYTRIDWAKEQVKRFIKDRIKQYLSSQNSVEDTIAQQVNSIEIT